MSGITTFSGQQYFIPPTGTTAERPSDCPPGSIRFNTDSAHLEYWNGLVWLEFEATSEELGDHNQTNSAGGTGHRGLFAGGLTPTIVDRIDFISISTLGNAQDFGNLVAVTRLAEILGCASATRGIFAGGSSPSPTKSNKIDFVTIASTGNASDFGNLTRSVNQFTAFSNSTRGITGGGDAGPVTDIIDYITIASTGDAQDFGNLLAANEQLAGCSNSIRGLFAGGNAGGITNVIQYITIPSTGDAQDFGDLTGNRNFSGSCSNSTRGLWGGGRTPSDVNIIDFVTIATTGNAQDFGDLTNARGIVV